MEKVKTLDEFYSQLKTEVELANENDNSGWTKEDYLTSIMLDYLDDAGEVNNPVICPFRDRGLQLNAYCFSEDYSLLNLYVTLYVNEDAPVNVGKNDVEAAIRRELSLYRKAINELYQSLEKDNDVFEFAKEVFDHKNMIEEVHVCCLTNGLVKSLPFKNITLENAVVSFTLWDLERLYKCIFSGKMREVIEIDFEKEFGQLISCIGNSTSKKYSTYLAIISGQLLAALYSKYHDRLLERNVRSFLQVRSKVNKGIRDTLRNEPEMFLAYNNGISVTAESVSVLHKEYGTFIKNIKDMQIVNGGQTTASIYTASLDKKSPVDLSKVWVQMKLSVIQSDSDMDEIVPKISACANTQNNIQIADFSANDPFHRKIEELSRTIWAPAQNGAKPVSWFYERARGQYADALAQQTTAKRRREFKEQHPYFTKTDLAKYENTWDQLPYDVSEGAQKNFKKFTVRLSQSRSFKPDEEYFHRLVAKAIIFKRAEKLVSDQKYGGYRANIVTYTLSFLSYKTGQRIDLNRIWKEQKLTSEFETEIIRASKLIHDEILKAPNGANVGEWCKKEQCWLHIKDLPFDLSPDFTSQLLSNDRIVKTPENTISTEKKSVVSAEDTELIEKCAGVKAATWFALARWAKETNNFQPWVRSLLFNVGTRVGRGQKPSDKQSRYAWKAYEEALEKGFESEKGKDN